MPQVEEYGFYFGILAVRKEIEEGVRGQNIFFEMLDRYDRKSEPGRYEFYYISENIF